MIQPDIPKRHPGKQYSGATFGRAIVDLDGIEFTDCTFRGTTIRYSGGELPRIVGCRFSETRFVMAGAADRTLKLLLAMSTPGSGMQSIVRDTFASIFAN